LQSTHSEFGSITRIISEHWKASDPAYKALLEEKVKPDRARYLEEMKEWEVNQQHEEMRSAINVLANNQKQLSKALEQMQSLETAIEGASCFSAHFSK
jgi:predicted house-cleaning noncanonical NTP pyrophosphatase (MazG superfamily)